MRFLAALALGTAAIASCGVDQSGLGSMPSLHHDASSGDSAGAAGVTGNPGAAGSSSPGTAGSGGTGGGAGSVITGTAGDGTAGTAGAAGTAGTPGTAGNGGAGVAGNPGTAGNGGAGVAGNPGTAGNGNAGVAGNPGTAGNGNAGMAGNPGTAGNANAGTAGNPGTAGNLGTAGNPGTAGIGGSAGVSGVGGVGGIGGKGGAGGIGLGGRGGTGGVSIPCTPTTCNDGCCKDSTTCIRMRSAAQCGSNGAACAPCGGCQICSSLGQCRIDSQSRWTIVAVSAQLAPSNWDRLSGEVGGSLPDPFCEFENPAGQVSDATAGVTTTDIDTLNATWNEVITPVGMTVSAATLMSTNPTWQIWVGDDDGCPTPSCLADVACTIKQPISEAQLRAGELVVNNRQSCNSVTIDFVCQPN